MLTEKESSLPLPPAITRRSFFSWLAIGWTFFMASLLTGGMASFRFLFPNVLFEPSLTFKAGHIDDYRISTVDERWKSRYGVWIVTTENELFALSSVCTHLGCTPNWFEGEGRFKCPCHGSVYNRSGFNLEGPAPRPLERYRISSTKNGIITVDKKRVFQYEKGEWENVDSRILL